MRAAPASLLGLALALGVAACGGGGGPAGDTATDVAPEDTASDGADAPPDSDGPGSCVLPAGDTAPFLQTLGCRADFDALASAPLDASIPGARSLKTVVDRVGGGALYFQNVSLYPTHWGFVAAHLSGHGLPPVPDLGRFNATEYSSPSRRFLLGALTWYEEPGVWVYELAPYDTASAAMITAAYDAIRAAAFFGDRLLFHPTSAAIERVAEGLDPHVARISTDALFAQITYQPLNLATAMGKLRFVRAADLTEGLLSFRGIVVLDRVPNELAVVSGVVTAELQTPLSHVNVLSQNRGTPNMALLGASSDPRFTALDGRWVELRVGAFDWSLREVDQATADAWWAAHKPPAITIPAPDERKTALTDVDEVLDRGAGQTLREALDAAIPAFGGKASHYAALRAVTAGGAPLPVRPGFAIPVAWYRRHLGASGLDAEIAAMLADPAFTGDATARAQRLEALRAAIMAAPLDPALEDAVTAWLDRDFPGTRVRFRSSTNAEDLDGFTGAGLYESFPGRAHDPALPVADAIRAVWASAWRFKAFEERAYRSIDHERVGMAILVHAAFRHELANGVAITANLFDREQTEPAFVINAQKGDLSVVLPPPGVLSDYLVYYWYYPGQPALYLTRSNLTTGGDVLTGPRLFELGRLLDAIQEHFRATYGQGPGFYGMDVEWKLDAPPGEAPRFWIKQARPHPGWGLE